MNANDIISIDADRLDREWTKHPQTFFLYAEELAKAKRDLDVAKAFLDVTDAELDKDIRDHPENYGVAKITEPVVANVILTCKKHQKANEQFIEARYKVGICQAAVDALDHKKAGLEALVKLQGMNYYSSPKAENEGDKEALVRKKVRRA